jgi:hypothetical protein
VLGVDVAAGPSLLLGLGDDAQGKGGLACSFGPVDLGDAASGDAADPQGEVESEAAGGDGRHRRRTAVRGGDHAGAEVAVDLG